MAISQPLVDAAARPALGSANRTACYYSKLRMAQGALIEVDSLLFRWPSASSPCLAIESLRIEAGERVFLFGPSGSGKSTLLALLAGVLTAQAGQRPRPRHRAVVAAEDATGFASSTSASSSSSSISSPICRWSQNVLLPCRFSAKRAQRATEAHGSPVDAAQHLLDAMGLGAALRKRKATELSVGQQQRVAAARALIGSPELIIADEPTSSLDADARQAFLEPLAHVNATAWRARCCS